MAAMKEGSHTRKVIVDDEASVVAETEDLYHTGSKDKLPHAVSSKHLGKGSFASLFKDNRIPEDNQMLDYVPTEIASVDVTLDEIDTVENAIGYCLVGCVLGLKPSIYGLVQLTKSWGLDVKFQLHQNGWITFSFPNERERDRILNGEQQMVQGRHLYLKLLPPCFLYRVEDMSFMPSWIQLYGLPADCWTHKVLSKVSSVVGRPVHMDKMTQTKQKRQYARILVELDSTKERIRDIEVNLPTGDTTLVHVVYECESKYCDDCQKAGHNTFDCKWLACQGLHMLNAGKYKRRGRSRSVARLDRSKSRGKSRMSNASEGHRSRSRAPGSVKDNVETENLEDNDVHPEEDEQEVPHHEDHDVPQPLIPDNRDKHDKSHKEKKEGKKKEAKKDNKKEEEWKEVSKKNKKNKNKKPQGKPNQSSSSNARDSDNESWETEYVPVDPSTKKMTKGGRTVLGTKSNLEGRQPEIASGNK